MRLTKLEARPLKIDQVRGKAFENLMVSVLNHLGYADFLINIHPVGTELDIEATHKTNRTKILCECKAEKKPIPPIDVKKFHSDLANEIDKKYVDKGYFFSISGFTSNTDRWYKESGKNIKRTMTLKGTQEIVELLRDSSLLSSDEDLDRIVQNNTSYQLGERRIDVFQSDVFIIQYLRLGGETTSYMILKGSGNIVPVSVMEQISKLDKDLENYSRLNPVITGLSNIEPS